MGVKLTNDCHKHTVTLSQTQYVESLLKQFRMEICNPVSTPMDPGIVLVKANWPKSDEEKEEMSRYPYCEALGSITWLTVMSCHVLTSPMPPANLASTAPTLAKPTGKHSCASSNIYRALTTWHSLGRVSDTDSDPNVITGHTDASWACDADDHCSTSGYIFQLGDAVISWNSKKQSNIAISSSKAEYVALAHSAKQALWLHYLTCNISMFNGGDPPTTELFSDNTATITITKEAHFHGWS